MTCSYLKHLGVVVLCSSALASHPQGIQQQPESPLPPDTGVTIHVQVNSVLVPVVVRDAAGHAVGDLSEKDFKVLDQGKPRNIAGFTVQQGAPLARGEQAAAPPAAGSQAAPETPQPPPEQRIIVFLFDDRHLSMGDLEQVKKAAVQMLDQPLADGTRGLVLSFMGVNSGITHNHTVLQAAVMSLKARQALQQPSSPCPTIDYYAADQILNRHNKVEYGIALDKAANCLHLHVPPSAAGNIDIEDVGSGDLLRAQVAVRIAATFSLENGDQDSEKTISYITDVVHTLSGLPGQRSLVLVSPGFLSLSQESMTRESQLLNLAASAAITISTLDARGLYSPIISASESGGESVQSMITGENLQDRDDSMRQNKQVMAEFADGTGGTFFHNNNDLQGGLTGLAAGPEYKYLLELSVNDVKQNGTYHALKVEVDRKDMKIQAREGYFAPLPPKNRK
jgi:VWFA-related protein